MVLDAEAIEPREKSMGELMQKILTLIGDTLITTSKSASSLLAVSAATLGSGNGLMGGTEFVLGLPKKLGGGDPCPVTEDNQISYAIINPGNLCEVQRRPVHINDWLLDSQGDPPVPAGILRNCSRRNAAFNGFGLPKFHPTHLREIDPSPYNLDPLWNPKRWPITLLGFKSRESGGSLEEPLEGLVKVAQGLLRQLTINLGQPGRCWLAFQLCQGLVEHSKSERSFRSGIVSLALRQGPIPNKAPSTGKAHALTHLFRRWFQAETEPKPMYGVTSPCHQCENCTILDVDASRLSTPTDFCLPAELSLRLGAAAAAVCARGTSGSARRGTDSSDSSGIRLRSACARDYAGSRAFISQRITPLGSRSADVSDQRVISSCVTERICCASAHAKSLDSKLLRLNSWEGLIGHDSSVPCRPKDNLSAIHPTT